jgi:hypothetical protein
MPGHFELLIIDLRIHAVVARRNNYPDETKVLEIYSDRWDLPAV